MTAEAKPPTTAELEKLRDEHCEGDPGRCAVKWCDRGTWADWPCLPYILAAEVLRLRGQAERVQTLFAGGPDTPCRTTWHEVRMVGEVHHIECVEVPMADLRAALDSEPGDQATADQHRCDNYLWPVTCLTAPSSLSARCQWCAESGDHS